MWLNYFQVYRDLRCACHSLFFMIWRVRRGILYNDLKMGFVNVSLREGWGYEYGEEYPPSELPF